jgi:hypothetical protein
MHFLPSSATTHSSHLLLRMLRTLPIIHLHVFVIVIVFIVVILILIAFQAIAFMEGREGLDLCFEAGGCKAF